MQPKNESFENPSKIRAKFSKHMSDMYQEEVPLYGDLLTLVEDINQEVLEISPNTKAQLERTGEIKRLSMERHGAIRVGTPSELSTIRRLFSVMGMEPVGYYDLTAAGVPVHSTAFRAVREEDLQVSPFRVFTSLLRLELIDNLETRQLAVDTLAKRQIFTPRLLELIKQYEHDGGLSQVDAETFIDEALETFRWHTTATVTSNEYKKLHNQHRLIADVVAFKGPHINHLTPRTLDIDQAQDQMPARNITPKAVVEGPPRRNCPILLRQTSFKALQEKVTFSNQGSEAGSHTARFGEIEQRGAALTPKGRALYDELLNASRSELKEFPNEENAQHYKEILVKNFSKFPDSYKEMNDQDLAYFRYFVTDKGYKALDNTTLPTNLKDLINAGFIEYEPLVYEDFLPVSAAGIFQSNLGDNAQAQYKISSNQIEFQNFLGTEVLDELDLYADTQKRSIEKCGEILNLALCTA
ncbi:VOC family protein [Marinomonas arenicola]|uniref:2-oxoadipate dioxygenase/decarboxylase HglS n=1 Tax=Marinomonas TaxID=28253 RepID=UPI0010561C45|nr:VOC family protein [Marinomonas sp. KMM3893]